MVQNGTEYYRNKRYKDAITAFNRALKRLLHKSHTDWM